MSLLDSIEARIRQAIEPLQTRVANSIARAVIERVDDSKKMQMLQLGVMAGETIDDCENFQGYGFTSKPLPGAEAVVAFPNGDRSHPLVVGVDDRRYRPELEDGESAMYSNQNLIIRMKADGTIEIGTIGGAFQPLAFKSDIDALATHYAAHAHVTTATIGLSPVGVIGPPTTALTTPVAVGTAILVAG